jgi:hypothetical protein
MKAYQAEHVSARTIVLGSSRSDVGFDPAHIVWPASLQPVYNLSLAGSDTATGLGYLQHLLAANSGVPPPDMLIVGLDFEYFLFDPTAVTAAIADKHDETTIGEVEQRFVVDAAGKVNSARPLRMLKDRTLALLSLDAIGDSVGSVFASATGSGANLEANGHLGESVFRQNVETDGVAALFEQKNLQAKSQLGSKHLALSVVPDGPIRDLVAVRRLCDFARARKIPVVLLIQPAHASRLDLLASMGYWKDYEHWKRELVALTEQQRLTGADVKLWDFGGYERYSEELIPPKGNRTVRLKWFWDPVHYTSAWGDVMIGRMFGTDASGGFGVELLPSNVENRLAEIRASQSLYRTATATGGVRKFSRTGNNDGVR